jgi:diguanylate cyclase
MRKSPMTKPQKNPASRFTQAQTAAAHRPIISTGTTPPWPERKAGAVSAVLRSWAQANTGGARGSAQARPPLRRAALGLFAAALVLSVLLAWGLQVLLPGALGLTVPVAWLAPLCAALGVVVAAAPAMVLIVRSGEAHSASAPETVSSQFGLDGVPRALFMDLAGREWARARRYGTGTALLLVQLDRFARLVEARGPDAADAALTELVRLTAPTLRAADLITRFSECEIAVFLVQSDATGALDVAERIRDRAEQLEVTPASLPGQKVRVTVSVGVAQQRPAHLNLHALAEDAEDAVDAASRAGGNCVRAAPIDASEQRASGSGPWRDGSKTQP